MSSQEMLPPAKTMAPPLASAKQQLRTAVKAALSSLPAASVQAQSQTCTQALLALPEYAAARRISVFLSMPRKEIDTRAIVEDSLRSGKRLYVPYIHRRPDKAAVAAAPPSLMDMLRVASLQDYRSLEPDSWGIPSIPRASASARGNCLDGPESGLDLVVMPGVAFDAAFRRLGHGKGYYDYFLSRYRDLLGSEKMPTLVAVAMKEQLVGEDTEIPTDPLDWPVDIIVTGEGTVLRRQSAP